LRGWQVATLAGCGREEQPGAEYPAAQTDRGGEETVKVSVKEEGPDVEPEADALLERMSAHLASLKTFSFDADNTLEVVTKDGQKLQFVAASHVSIRRPDKIRSDRKGEKADLTLYYDGKTITIHGKRLNLYAQAPAPDNIDDAIDFMRDKLELEAPASDLAYSNPYDVLMEDVVSGKVLGTAEIDGVKCTHLAYRGKSVDWQLWIEDGPAPLPRKYLITTKDVQGEPEFSVTLHNWNTSADLPNDLFTFTPPAGAQRIEFLQALEKRKSATPEGGKP
jgi:hypothetical protein